MVINSTEADKGEVRMKHVGIKEFRDRAASYFKAAEPIAVERHGRLIGFYIPVESKRASEAELNEMIDRLEASVTRALEESGMTEDEFADYFDLSKPPPDLAPGNLRKDGEPE